MGEKTTIEIENLQALKQHALDTRKTLKQLINEAIEEKIERERESLKMPPLNSNKVEKPSNTPTSQSPVSTRDMVTEFKEFINERGLTAVIEKELNKYFLSLSDISPEKITSSLINDVKEAITLIYDDETAELVAEKLQTLTEVQ